MLDNPIARRLAGAGGGAAGPGADMGGGSAPTGGSDDQLMQDFLTNPNPQLGDVIDVVKALIRDDQNDDEGGAEEGAPPMPPPPGGAGGGPGLPGM